MIETKKELTNAFKKGEMTIFNVYDCATEYHQLTRILLADDENVFGYVVPYSGVKKEFFKRKVYYTASSEPFFKLNGSVYYLHDFLRNDSYSYTEDIK